MKKFSGMLGILLFAAATAKSQSYHFSQFFSTPLLTNPAQTGNIDGPYRVASNFRAQGVAGGSPYLTGYLSADISPFKEKLLDGHRAGVGIFVMNDQALNGALNTNAIGFSAAYTVGLDANKVHSLGLGFQGVYHQRELDFNKLSFDQQFDRNGYNPAMPVGESFLYYKRNYFDLNAGLLYRAQFENATFFGGASAYNIMKHEDNVLGDEFKMPARFVFQGGTSVHAGPMGTVYGSLTYMQQARASEMTFGAAYGFQLTDGERNEITLGAWYRLKDALIPYVGYHKNGFQLGITYDYTTSAKRTGAQVKNGYEVTLMYSAPDKNALKRALPWY